MDLSFEQLKSMVVFAHVAGRGSFSAAARHMGLSRGVVSYHIKKLERQLGVQLLNRSTRSLSLTEEGRSYYAFCKTITEQAASAQQQMENFRQVPEGLLKITCPVNMGLQIIVPALNEFKQRYPKIELDIVLADQVVNILEEGIDLAIRGAPLADSSLQAVQLAVLKTHICGSPAYFRKHGRPQSPEDLSRHNWVMYQLSSGSLELRKGERSFSIRPQGDISTNNAAARTAFVEGGHGLGRIPAYDAAPKIRGGTLESVLDDYQLNDIEVYGVFAPGAAKTKKLRVLLDFLKLHYAGLEHQRLLSV